MAINYANYIFKQPDSAIRYGNDPSNIGLKGVKQADGTWAVSMPGFYYTIVNGIARKLADQQAAAAIAPNAPELSFSSNTIGYDPQHGGGTTGPDWSLANFKNTVDTYAAQGDPNASVTSYDPNTDSSHGQMIQQSQPVQQTTSQNQQNNPLDPYGTGKTYTSAANPNGYYVYNQKGGIEWYSPSSGSGSRDLTNNSGASSVGGRTLDRDPNSSTFGQLISTTGATNTNNNLPDSANAVLDATVDHLTNSIINPDTEITPEMTAQYLAQAKTELGPYYTQLLNQAQADLKNTFSNIGQDLATNERNLETTYGQNLQNTQESMANRGLTFSSTRDKAEKTLADSTQAAIEAGRTAAQRAAMSAGTAGERLLGSENLPKLPGVADAPTPILNQPGVYALSKPTTTRDLFTPVGGTTGTQQQDQLTATNKRVLDLTNNERQYRSLNTV